MCNNDISKKILSSIAFSDIGNASILLYQLRDTDYSLHFLHACLKVKVL